MKKATSILMSIFILMMQLTAPALAAELIGTQTTSTPTKSATTSSTQTSTQSSTTQTTSQFMAAGALSAAAVTTTEQKAISNANFSFVTVNDGTQKQIFLKNKSTGNQDLITTVQSSQTVTGMDVDPSGKIALVNVHRIDGYVSTGDLHLFSIAQKTIVKPDLIALYGSASQGKMTIQGRVSTNYHFMNGLALINTYTYTAYPTGSTNSRGVVLNIDALRATTSEAPYWQAYGVLATPQGDKLVFGTSQRGNDSIAIYDMASGKITYKPLPPKGFSGIKAISADGNYAIAASTNNAVYVAPIRNTSSAATILFPTAGAASLSSAKFVSETFAELTFANGQKFFLDVVTGRFIAMSTLAHQTILKFYGGSLPDEAAYTKSVTKKDANGVTIGWDVTVELNRSMTPGELHHQVIMIRKIGSVWSVKVVRDEDRNNKILTTSVFNYVAYLLDNITRYQGAMSLKKILSTIKVVRPTHYEITITATKETKNIPLSTSLNALLNAAKSMGG